MAGEPGDLKFRNAGRHGADIGLTTSWLKLHPVRPVRFKENFARFYTAGVVMAFEHLHGILLKESHRMSIDSIVCVCMLLDVGKDVRMY